MDTLTTQSDIDPVTADTFVQVTEIWVPEGNRLVLSSGVYGMLEDFANTSAEQSFAYGEGLPGKAWAEGRPVVLKAFEGSYFKRTEAAIAAGLTAAVAIPVFDDEDLKAVLVVLCGDDEKRTGAIEIWQEHEGLLTLADGYYGAAKHFEWVSQHTSFPKGQGLPGGVWASNTPMLMRDLGSGYRFIRAESAGQAGLTTGLGLPVPQPNGETVVLALLSAKGTPIARRFEIWDARAAEALLVDGLCEREGPLWGSDRRITAWKGPLGQALATGVPVVASGGANIAQGYGSLVALPIIHEGKVVHIVAWYY